MPNSLRQDVTEAKSDTPLSVRIAAIATFAYLTVASVSPYLYGTFLAPLIGGALALMILERQRVPRTGLAWTMVLTALGLLGVTLGALNGNPGAVPTLRIYVLEPLVLGLFFCIAGGSPYWRMKTIRAIDLTALILGVTGAYIVAIGTWGQVAPTWLTGETHNFVDVGNGILRTNYLGYGALAFLAPYTIVRYFTRRKVDSNLSLLVAVILAIFGVLVAGRNILFISTPVAVIVALAIRATSMKRAGVQTRANLGRRVAMLSVLSVAALPLLGTVMGFTVSDLVSRFVDSFSVSDESGVRQSQSEMLLAEWSERPIVGHGAGATVPGLIRSQTAPWAFELTYHQLLLCFGLFGFAILAVWYLWTMKALARQVPVDELPLTALIAGLVGSVVAATVNPYILQFDGIWMVLLPFGVAAGSTLRSAQGRRNRQVQK